MSLIAKGALRSRHRFGGGILEPLHLVQGTYVVKNSSQTLFILDEAILLRGFEELKKDYERLTTALSLTRDVLMVVQEGVVDSQEIFDLLGNALIALGTIADLTKFRIHFDIKLLWVQGVLATHLQSHPLLRLSLAKGDSWTASPESLMALRADVDFQFSEFFGVQQE